MDNLFVISGTIAIIYMIVRIAEMKFVLKETKPIKELVRDSVVVCVSGILGLFILDQFSTSINKSTPTSAFTGAPDF
jgi:hypothetical protein